MLCTQIPSWQVATLMQVWPPLQSSSIPTCPAGGGWHVPLHTKLAQSDGCAHGLPGGCALLV
jgi:hypothetical protein